MVYAMTNTNQDNEEQSSTTSPITITGLTDLLGASAPLKRLVSAVSTGLGSITAAWLLRKNARATSQGIRALDDALKEAGLDPISAEASIDERAAIRVTYEHRRRQRNIESVLAKAYHALGAQQPDQPATDRDDSISDDWLANYFGCAKEVSEELMQHLWARVLTLESTTPGTFSLRALDSLRLMAKSEAEAFARVCRASYRYKSEAGVFVPNERAFLEEHKKFISYADVSLLESFGLFYSDGMLGQFRPAHDNGKCSLCIAGARFVIALGGREKFDIAAHYRFTPVGVELMSLLDKQINREYVDFARRLIESRGHTIEKIE